MVRRVVTGLDDAGKPSIVHDGEPTRTHRFTHIPGMSNALIWTTRSPAAPSRDLTLSVERWIRSAGGAAQSAPRWFGGHVRSSALVVPDKTALVFEGRSWTYAQLDAAVTRVVELLRGLGVAKGDRVIMQGLPRPEAFILPFAV